MSLKITIVLNILNLLMSVAVELTNFVLRRKAKAPNYITGRNKRFLYRPFYFKTYLFLYKITN